MLSVRDRPSRRAVAFAVAAGLGISLPVCHADAASLSAMVLPPSSVPKGFTQTIFRSYTRAQIAAQGTWDPADLRRWGYQRGQEAQYDRGADTGRDPAQLSSDAGMYRTAGGARSAISANRDACARNPWSKLPVSRIGAETYACRQRGIVRGRPAEVHFVVWRCGRYKGAITLTGPRNRFGLADAVDLGRRQARHMPC